MQKQVKEYNHAKRILEILVDGDSKIQLELADIVTIEQIEELRYTVDYYEGKHL